jgi:DNA-directed RNA polymerase subunit RPC12/RpoP
MSAKVLLLDIETAPLRGFFWGLWKQNIGYKQLENEWYMLTWAAKWLDSDEYLYDSVHLHGDHTDDRAILESLHGVLDDADIVVAHNGNRFDIPKINARLIQAGLEPPSPYKKIDTFQVAKRQFAFTSNRLDSIAEFLGIGGKVSTGGFELWVRCLEGDKEAFEKMVEYNIQDVHLLEEVYKRMLPWIPNHPNVANLADEGAACPKCGSKHLQRRGYSYTQVGKYQRYQCMSCGGWSRTRTAERESEENKSVLTNAVD